MEQTAETADNLVNSMSNQTDQTYTPAEHGTAAELTGGLQKERPSVLDSKEIYFHFEARCYISISIC